MHTFRKNIAAFVVLSAMAMPLAVSAETNLGASLNADQQTKIQALLTQIKLLQEQIKTIVGSTTMKLGLSNSGPGSMNSGQMGKMACISLSRNLRQGDQGDDVRKLQDMLRGDDSNEFHASSTGLFGPLTMRAMMKFQMRMGIASSTDGSVGPLTRGFFERSCGKGLDGMQGKMQGGMNGAAILGTVASNSGSSITVTNGSSTLTVQITTSTEIKVFVGTSTKSTGTVIDLTVGKQVMVDGAKNADGSIQARQIVVGDNLPMMKGGDDHGMNSGPGIMMQMIEGFRGSIVPGGNSGPGGGDH